MNDAILKTEQNTLAEKTTEKTEDTPVEIEATTEPNQTDSKTEPSPSDLPEPPEGLTGLIDPEKYLNPAHFREEDLQIARNLRRLEVHRYEIATALETLTKTDDIGPLIDEEAEEDINLTEAEQHYVAHIEIQNQRRQQKIQRRRKKQLSYQLTRFTYAIHQLTNNSATKNHTLYKKWHNYFYDQKVEQRLFTPETNLPTDTKTPESDQPASAPTNDTEHNMPLCAPVKLVNWSLSKLANYQEGESFRHFLFVDPKAGHGRTALIAAKHDFRAIWAIEEQEHIAGAATMNIAQYPRTEMVQHQIEILTTQLTPEQWPDMPLLLHIFSPPTEAWLTTLLESISVSFFQTPRQIYLVLINNPFKHLFANHTNLQRFTPPTGHFEQLTLLSPYDIEFYHNVIPPAHNAPSK